MRVARDPRHLGAEIGFFSVLHTWNQRLQHHPHVHCVIAAADSCKAEGVAGVIESKLGEAAQRLKAQDSQKFKNHRVPYTEFVPGEEKYVLLRLFVDGRGQGDLHLKILGPPPISIDALVDMKTLEGWLRHTRNPVPEVAISRAKQQLAEFKEAIIPAWLDLKEAAHLEGWLRWPY